MEIGNTSLLYELNTRVCENGSEEEYLAMVSSSSLLLMLQASLEEFELPKLMSHWCCGIWFLPKEHFVLFLSLTVEEALVAFGLGFLYNDVEELGSVAACYYKVFRQVLNKNVQLIKCHNKDISNFTKLIIK